MTRWGRLGLLLIVVVVVLGHEGAGGPLCLIIARRVLFWGRRTAPRSSGSVGRFREREEVLHFAERRDPLARRVGVVGTESQRAAVAHRDGEVGLLRVVDDRRLEVDRAEQRRADGVRPVVPQIVPARDEEARAPRALGDARTLEERARGRRGRAVSRRGHHALAQYLGLLRCGVVARARGRGAVAQRDAAADAVDDERPRFGVVTALWRRLLLVRCVRRRVTRLASSPKLRVFFVFFVLGMNDGGRRRRARVGDGRGPWRVLVFVSRLRGGPRVVLLFIRSARRLRHVVVVTVVVGPLRWWGRGRVGTVAHDLEAPEPVVALERRGAPKGEAVARAR
mmetsp:Transcript_5833/g.24347  ORF Transcript_5833/g.24347 Transcript_5833/m.24347 type:complete len:338 (-) Transcript_5833:409-1422(-)